MYVNVSNHFIFLETLSKCGFTMMFIFVFWIRVNRISTRRSVLMCNLFSDRKLNILSTLDS